MQPLSPAGAAVQRPLGSAPQPLSNVGAAVQRPLGSSPQPLSPEGVAQRLRRLCHARWRRSAEDSASPGRAAAGPAAWAQGTVSSAATRAARRMRDGERKMGDMAVSRNEAAPERPGLTVRAHPFEGIVPGNRRNHPSFAPLAGKEIDVERLR